MNDRRTVLIVIQEMAIMNPASLVFLTVGLAAALSRSPQAPAKQAPVRRFAAERRVRSVMELRGRGLRPIGPIIDFSYQPPRRFLTDLELHALLVERTSYRGLQLGLNPFKSFDGVDNRSVEDICRQLERLDFVPPERSRHFSWCVDNGVVINGWFGVVDGITPMDDGWRVTIATAPSLYKYGARILITSDRVEETYFIQKSGRLSYIRAVERCGDGHGRITDF